MLRLTEKKDFAIQTEIIENEEVEEHQSKNIKYYGYGNEKDSVSWRKRMEISTGESELTSETRCERVTHLVSRKQNQSKEKEREREK
jgi:hypothetical protein